MTRVESDPFDYYEPPKDRDTCCCYEWMLWIDCIRFYSQCIRYSRHLYGPFGLQQHLWYKEGFIVRLLAFWPSSESSSMKPKQIKLFFIQQASMKPTSSDLFRHFSSPFTLKWGKLCHKSSTLVAKAAQHTVLLNNRKVYWLKYNNYPSMNWLFCYWKQKPLSPRTELVCPMYRMKGSSYRWCDLETMKVQSPVQGGVLIDWI